MRTPEEHVEVDERQPDAAEEAVDGQVDQLRSELAAAQAKIDSLQNALESSRRIAAAVGVLMASQKITYDDAFGLLSRVSQASQLKVRDLAEEVLLTGALPDHRRW
jgi:AmiR/NasT family two-component response regulator